MKRTAMIFILTTLITGCGQIARKPQPDIGPYDNDGGIEPSPDGNQPSQHNNQPKDTVPPTGLTTQPHQLPRKEQNPKLELKKCNGAWTPKPGEKHNCGPYGPFCYPCRNDADCCGGSMDTFVFCSKNKYGKDEELNFSGQCIKGVCSTQAKACKALCAYPNGCHTTMPILKAPSNCQQAKYIPPTYQKNPKNCLAGLKDGDKCDDGLMCTYGDTCQAGKCRGTWATYCLACRNDADCCGPIFCAGPTPVALTGKCKQGKCEQYGAINCPAGSKCFAGQGCLKVGSGTP